MYSHCHGCLYKVKWLVNLCEQILTFKKINQKDRDFPVIHFRVSFRNSCTFSLSHNPRSNSSSSSSSPCRLGRHNNKCWVVAKILGANLDRPQSLYYSFLTAKLDWLACGSARLQQSPRWHWCDWSLAIAGKHKGAALGLVTTSINMEWIGWWQYGSEVLMTGMVTVMLAAYMTEMTVMAKRQRWQWWWWQRWQRWRLQRDRGDRDDGDKDKMTVMVVTVP